MKRFKLSLPFKLLLVCALLAFAASAQALTLDPTITPAQYELSGDDQAQSTINAIIGPYVSPSFEVWVADEGDPVTYDGLLEDSYVAAFYSGTDDDADPSNKDNINAGEIRWVGPNIVQPIRWLSIKDGKADPNWYLFNLTILGWDGQETILLRNFFLSDGTTGGGGGGSISNVRLYGGEKTQVPEPTTMLLLGTALFGLVVARRRFKK